MMGQDLQKPHIHSGLPAITNLWLHPQRTTPLKLNGDGPSSVARLPSQLWLKGRFHTCNFGVEQTKEVGTTMISSESTARSLRSTCADQTSIYCRNNGCGEWISSLHVSAERACELIR